MMSIAIKTNLRSKTFANAKSFSSLRKKETILVDTKFYQKLFVVFISLSAILIFPDSPKNLENICESYNSRRICNVW